MRSKALIIDVTAALALSWLAAAATLDPPGPHFDGPAWTAWTAGAALGLPIALRRRWPLAVLAGVTAVAALATVSGVVGAGVLYTSWLPVAVALGTVAATGTAAPAREWIVTVAALVAPAVTIPWFYARTGIGTDDAPGSEVPLWWQVELGTVAVLLIGAWSAGRVLRWRRAARTEATRRLAVDAVAAERLRIARELHDIVGHSMSLIAVKATVANHIVEARPDEARAALVTIEQTSRAALTEIRRLLDVLRDDDDADVDLTPSPGVADLPALAERMRSAGLPVELSVVDTDALPAAAGLTVYRIVQEALTNVVRHARAGRCRVSVRTEEGAVRIEVVDDGRASARRPAGRGLIGMRERVAVYGGTLRTGPRPEGGFRVEAVIPHVREAA